MSLTKTPQSPIVVCFGEILWDIFPNEKKAGGAPFNVAYNLKQQGVDTHMITRLGKDELGARLMARIKDWGMSLENCQVDVEHPTGTVLATIDEHNEAHYDIVTDVAWDYIQLTENSKALVANAAVLVYGSLASRNETSRHTLFQLLEVADYKVFDINLRPPFYSIELLADLMSKANLVKTNKAELRLVLELLNTPFTSEAKAVQLLQHKFGVKEFLITKGSKGAAYYGNGQHFELPAIPITIKDTVGSGDSFLSGFLAKKIYGADVTEAMINALAMGAFITTKAGACPPYTQEEFELFKTQNPFHNLQQ